MIVMLIIGVVYGLVINSMQRYSEKTLNLNLSSLPDFLKTNYPDQALSFICTNACQKCGVYIDSHLSQEVETFLDDSVKSYVFNHQYGLSELSWPSIFDEDGREEEVCFKYEQFEDESSAKMLVSHKGKLLSYPGYFGEIMHYSSLEEANNAFKNLLRKATK